MQYLTDGKVGHPQMLFAKITKQMTGIHYALPSDLLQYLIGGDIVDDAHYPHCFSPFRINLIDFASWVHDLVFEFLNLSHP
jgi:hypothetical protein